MDIWTASKPINVVILGGYESHVTTDPTHGPLLTSSCNIIAQQTEDKRDNYAPDFIWLI